MATFLLVHGAWHGGWCWQRVTDILQGQGHTVHAPTLTGVCERFHLSSPAINLTTHVLDIVNEIKWKELTDFVLVGHSYGGMVITGVTEQCHDRIASIVYLDAFLPKDGQSLSDIVGGEHPAEDGMVQPLPAEFFQVNLADRAWVDQQTTPQSAACFTERLQVSGALEKIGKKAYVQAKQGALPPFEANFASFSNDPAWTCKQMECGHDVMIDDPEEVARFLIEVA